MNDIVKDKFRYFFEYKGVSESGVTQLMEVLESFKEAQDVTGIVIIMLANRLNEEPQTLLREYFEFNPIQFVKEKYN